MVMFQVLTDANAMPTRFVGSDKKGEPVVGFAHSGMAQAALWLVRSRALYPSAWLYLRVIPERYTRVVGFVHSGMAQAALWLVRSRR